MILGSIGIYRSKSAAPENSTTGLGFASIIIGTLGFIMGVLVFATKGKLSKILLLFTLIISLVALVCGFISIYPVRLPVNNNPTTDPKGKGHNGGEKGESDNPTESSGESERDYDSDVESVEDEVFTKRGHGNPQVASEFRGNVTSSGPSSPPLKNDSFGLISSND